MKNKTNKIIVALIISLLVSVLLIYFFVLNGNTTIIKHNVIHAEEYKGDNVIELYKDHESDGERFITSFMFPGDSESKNYNLKAYYKGDVKIYFRIHNYDSLQELMDIYYDEEGKVVEEYGPRVKVVIDGVKYYEGFFRDLPKNFVVTRNASKKTIDTIKYQITLSLDAGVQSDFTLDEGKYQGKVDHFDMEWWIEGGEPYKPIDTGVRGIVSNPNTYVILMVGGFCALIFFLKRGKKNYE